MATNNWDILRAIEGILARPQTPSYVRLVAIIEATADIDLAPANENQATRDEVDKVLTESGLFT